MPVSTRHLAFVLSNFKKKDFKKLGTAMDDIRQGQGMLRFLSYVKVENGPETTVYGYAICTKKLSLKKFRMLLSDTPDHTIGHFKLDLDYGTGNTHAPSHTH